MSDSKNDDCLSNTSSSDQDHVGNESETDSEDDSVYDEREHRPAEHYVAEADCLDVSLLDNNDTVLKLGSSWKRYENTGTSKAFSCPQWMLS